jgi:hypothetical protein
VDIRLDKPLNKAFALFRNVIPEKIRAKVIVTALNFAKDVIAILSRERVQTRDKEVDDDADRPHIRFEFELILEVIEVLDLLWSREGKSTHDVRGK